MTGDVATLNHRLTALMPSGIKISIEASVYGGGLVFASIGMCAPLLHLPCNMVVSEGNDLSDEAIQPWWPFSDAAYVYPLIPWGDIGPTVILMVGIIAIAKRNSQLS